MKTEIQNFFERIGITEEQLGGWLDLRGTSITKLPDNLTVGGSLYLRGTSITKLPDNLTVGGSLDLENCTSITSLPDNLTVGGWLDLHGTSITKLPDNLTVGGSLDLENCTSITSLPDNLTVGGSLDLRGTSITKLPDNLTVGGSLDLRGTSITKLPDNLTVGGSLDLENCTSITGKAKDIEHDYIFQWRNGKYIQVDNIMTEVLHTRGNTKKVRIVGKRKDSYLVTDGNGKWAHGETLAKAKEDLNFKIISEKLKSEPIKADTVITIR